MKNERLLLFLLSIIQFAHILDFMIIMPLGKTLMKSMDISPQQFTFIVASYSIAAFAMSLLSALFIDRFDRKYALLFLNAGFTIGTLACSFAPDYWGFLAARSLAGAFGGTISALILSIIADTIPYERRSTAMGFVMTAFSAASILGVPAGIYLSATYSWRAPFFILGLLSILVTLMIYFIIPSLRKHLETGLPRVNPFRNIYDILKNDNQRKALLFNVVLMLGHFTIIPFLAPYMESNIGFSEYDVTYIYLIGGGFTVVLLPLYGKLADKYGNLEVFTIANFLALFSIFAITNLPAVSLAVALCVTSSYFVVASGRSVPATTMVTSVVRPENRGSFMSLRASVVQLSLGLGSVIAGMIVTENPDGTLANYSYVGYIAISMSILAWWLARKLRVAEGN